MNKHFISGTILVICVIIGIYAYYHYNEIHPSTDNAYVNANLVNISPKINGDIKEIYVENNQFVHKGDLLIKINPQDYIIMLDKTKQALELYKQQAKTAEQQIKMALVNVKKAQEDYRIANIMQIRYTDLFQLNATSEQDMQRYQNQAIQANHVLSQAKISVEQAKTQYKISIAQIELAKTDVQAALNHTNYTKLYAPVDGYISNLNLQIGELVGQGQKLLGIVDNKSWWIDANFKETQIKRIKEGQPVTVKLDMYNHKYKGKIKSISYASGNTFSLLPAENATGNWVKVTQRYTVRIMLENDPNYPLRVGASSKVTVNTSN